MKVNNKKGSISGVMNIMLLLIIFALIWAFKTEIDQAVRATAVVEPPSRILKIQSPYSGTVKTLAVEIGDKVKKGDPLVILDLDDIRILKQTVETKIELQKQERAIIEKLVKRGLEPKIRLIALDQQIADLVEKKQRFDLQIMNSTIVSDSEGVISAVHSSGKGDVLKGGEVLMEVVPDSDHYLIKAKIAIKDIGKVTIGQKASVSFTAYDYSRYGRLNAVITKIARNTTKSEERGHPSYYEAWLKTTTDTFSKGNVKPNLMPGMEAQVDLLAKKITVADYILAPLKKGASQALTEQ